MIIFFLVIQNKILIFYFFWLSKIAIQNILKKLSIIKAFDSDSVPFQKAKLFGQALLVVSKKQSFLE